MKRSNAKTKGGYTIIETMFLIIITIGMGALLNANLLHQKSSDMRSIIDSLSFVMEDMSRNLRTGSDYHCILGGETIPGGTPAARSCAGGGGGVSFKSAPPDASQWIYYIGVTPDGYGIFKSAGGTTVQLTPDEVDIDLDSSFVITGAEPPPEDEEQPFVTIKLIGNITFKDVVTPFSLQTSVSQRKIDL